VVSNYAKNSIVIANSVLRFEENNDPLIGLSVNNAFDLGKRAYREFAKS
jgi:hypothetical protein